MPISYIHEQHCGSWYPYNTRIQCISRHGINSSTPGQNGRHFTENIFRCILVNEKFCILKFVHKAPIDINPALVQIMARHWIGDKSFSEPMLIQFTDAYMRHYGKTSFLVFFCVLLKPPLCGFGGHIDSYRGVWFCQCNMQCCEFVCYFSMEDASVAWNGSTCPVLCWEKIGGIMGPHWVMLTLWQGHIFNITGPLCGESTWHQWIPLTKGQ